MPCPWPTPLRPRRGWHPHRGPAPRPRLRYVIGRVEAVSVARDMRLVVCRPPFPPRPPLLDPHGSHSPAKHDLELSQDIIHAYLTIELYHSRLSRLYRHGLFNPGPSPGNGVQLETSLSRLATKERHILRHRFAARGRRRRPR
eukprot:scaffold40808_cov70-Phaeocystis_antarctica.AAC.1